MTIRNKIESHLSKRNDYDKESDNILIDELVFNIETSQLARTQIKQDGITVTNRFGVIVRHPAMDVYNGCIKNINALVTKLGISRQERQKLKLEAEVKKDEYDKAFELN